MLLVDYPGNFDDLEVSNANNLTPSQEPAESEPVPAICDPPLIPFTEILKQGRYNLFRRGVGGNPSMPIKFLAPKLGQLKIKMEQPSCLPIKKIVMTLLTRKKAMKKS